MWICLSLLGILSAQQGPVQSVAMVRGVPCGLRFLFTVYLCHFRANDQLLHDVGFGKSAVDLASLAQPTCYCRPSSPCLLHWTTRVSWLAFVRPGTGTYVDLSSHAVQIGC